MSEWYLQTEVTSCHSQDLMRFSTSFTALDYRYWCHKKRFCHYFSCEVMVKMDMWLINAQARLTNWKFHSNLKVEDQWSPVDLEGFPMMSTRKDQISIDWVLLTLPWNICSTFVFLGWNLRRSGAAWGRWHQGSFNELRWWAMFSDIARLPHLLVWNSDIWLVDFLVTVFGIEDWIKQRLNAGVGDNAFSIMIQWWIMYCWRL